MSKAGTAYKRRVWACWVTSGCPRRPGKVGVRFDVHPPDRRARDLDNLGKGLLDAMKGRYFADDADVDDLRFVRCEVRKGGLVVVTLWGIE